MAAVKEFWVLVDSFLRLNKPKYFIPLDPNANVMNQLEEDKKKKATTVTDNKT